MRRVSACGRRIRVENGLRTRAKNGRRTGSDHGIRTESPSAVFIPEVCLLGAPGPGFRPTESPAPRPTDFSPTVCWTMSRLPILRWCELRISPRSPGGPWARQGPPIDTGVRLCPTELILDPLDTLDPLGADGIKSLLTEDTSIVEDDRRSAGPEVRAIETCDHPAVAREGAQETKLGAVRSPREVSMATCSVSRTRRGCVASGRCLRVRLREQVATAGRDAGAAPQRLGTPPPSQASAHHRAVGGCGWG